MVGPSDLEWRQWHQVLFTRFDIPLWQNFQKNHKCITLSSRHPNVRQCRHPNFSSIGFYLSNCLCVTRRCDGTFLHSCFCSDTTCTCFECTSTPLSPNTRFTVGRCELPAAFLLKIWFAFYDLIFTFTPFAFIILCSISRSSRINDCFDKLMCCSCRVKFYVIGFGRMELSAQLISLLKKQKLTERYFIILFGDNDS